MSIHKIQIGPINWQLLRLQKEWLLAQDSEYAEGLVNLLDHLQDTAVDQGVCSDEVFSQETHQ